MTLFDLTSEYADFDSLWGVPVLLPDIERDGGKFYKIKVWGLIQVYQNMPNKSEFARKYLFYADFYNAFKAEYVKSENGIRPLSECEMDALSGLRYVDYCRASIVLTAKRNCDIISSVYK